MDKQEFDEFCTVLYGNHSILKIVLYESRKSISLIKCLCTCLIIQFYAELPRKQHCLLIIPFWNILYTAKSIKSQRSVNFPLLQSAHYIHPNVHRTV